MHETYRITSRVSNELRSLPGVRSVGAHVGRAITGDQIVGINSSQIWVGIDPEADYDKTIAAIRETIDGYPGVDHNVQTYLRDKVGEALSGDDQGDRRAHLRPETRSPATRRPRKSDRRFPAFPGLSILRVEGQTEEPQSTSQGGPGCR